MNLLKIWLEMKKDGFTIRCIGGTFELLYNGCRIDELLGNDINSRQDEHGFFKYTKIFVDRYSIGLYDWYDGFLNTSTLKSKITDDWVDEITQMYEDTIGEEDEDA